MAQHLALYRKWRPLVFEDVFGQEHITSALKTQVETDRVSHAYLFTGTRGTGKTTCAKILARAVCCEHPVNGSPCNRCAACRSILEDAALDVSEIDAASNNGVDNIRDIREEAAFSPTTLKKRVYIIDEVHMLSPGAFNALLKTLEEPPEHVLFILATTEIHKVPATVLSRCQRYDFRRIPPEIIAARLHQIAAAEGFTLESAAAALLARLGDGSMRDAISLLDRSVSADGNIDLNRVTEALGVPSGDTVLRLYQAVQAGDAAGALELFTGSYLEGRDMVSLFDQLLSLLRDVYLLRATGREEYLMSSSAARPEIIRTLARDANPEELEYFVRCVSDLLTRLTRTAIKRTDGEMCLLKMALRHSFGAATPRETPAAVRTAAAPQRTAAPTVQNPAPVSEPAPMPERKETAPQPEAAMPKTAEPAPRPAGTTPPVRTAAPDTEEDDPAVRSAFLAVVGPKVSGAVRTYLNLSRMCVKNGILDIACREESMIFMNKPAVQQLLREAAVACGHSGVQLHKQGTAAKAPVPEPEKPAEPAVTAKPGSALEEILANARRMGVEIREKK